MVMTLYQYFARAKEITSLPDPNGPFSATLPSSKISAVNKEVAKVLPPAGETGPVDEDADHSKKSRGPYVKLTQREKAEIGKNAAEHGVASTLRKFAKKHPGLKKSTVKLWQDAYKKELKIKVRDPGNAIIEVEELPMKKRGRPFLLGEKLDQQVKQYVTTLRENGAVINTSIVVACAAGVVKSEDHNLLASNGGHISLTKNWGKSFLKRMGFVKRRASTSAKVMPDKFDELKAQYIFDVKVNIEMDEIPADLVINWDQTGIHYIPVGQWTIEKAGSKRVEIVANDDKHQITAVLAGSLTGEFLPPQLIYKGTTPRCLPTVDFPPDWDITYSTNHWSNEKSMESYVMKILIPFINKKKEELKLPQEQRALVIFDQFKGQLTDRFLKLLEQSNLSVVTIPAHCTDRLQPMDVSVNKAVKSFLQNEFQEWYSQTICQQLNEGTSVTPVDLRLSVIKPLGAKWMIKLYDYMRLNPDIIRNGFKGAGIIY